MTTPTLSGRAPRVTLTGAPCVGKSTLARALVERLGVPLLPERSREVAREWGLTPATIPLERGLEFQWAILERQIQAEEAHASTGFVSDRCPVDSLCHFEWFAQDMHWWEEDGPRYREAVEARLDTYDLLIVIPPMFPMVDDGERIADPEFQSGLHGVIDELVASWRTRLGDRLHVVDALDFETRLQRVLDALRTRV